MRVAFIAVRRDATLYSSDRSVHFPKSIFNSCNFPAITKVVDRHRQTKLETKCNINFRSDIESIISRLWITVLHNLEYSKSDVSHQLRKSFEVHIIIDPDRAKYILGSIKRKQVLFSENNQKLLLKLTALVVILITNQNNFETREQQKVSRFFLWLFIRAWNQN